MTAQVAQGFKPRDLWFFQTGSTTSDNDTTTDVKEVEEHKATAGLSDAVDNHDRAYYDTELNYRLDVTKGGSLFLWGGTFAVLRRKWQPAAVRIHNAKGRENDFSLDTHGFQFAHCPTKTTEFPWNPWDEHLFKTYNPECEAYIKQLTGCTSAKFMSHMIRQRDIDGNAEADAAKADMTMVDGGAFSARYVHIDQSEQGALKAMYDGLGPEACARHLAAGHRWAIMNMWRPVETIHREPLAVCEAHSVRDDELYETGHAIPFRWPDLPMENQMYTVAPPTKGPEQHRWWFRSGMTRDDVLVIKMYDSKKNVARRIPHSAFVTPDDVGPIRRSIETRFIVVWED